MAIPKVLGTETEFGITIRQDDDFNPVLASGLVVNGSPDGLRLRWSLAEESPGRDARGGKVGTGVALDAETLNVLLANGARMYVDHAHPEYSTPECLDVREAALHDKAGELAMVRAASAAREILDPGQRISIYKNNSDGKGNSYGAHENYLVARSLPFDDIVRYLTTFLVTRQVFTGSGKVGVENGRPDEDYQISQRADFFEERVGLETTLRRPIINTRDEPHGDPKRFRRLHVIIGDATRSEIQTYVKLGTTALILAAIEDEALPEDLELADPVAATWQVSHDVTLGRPLQLAGGGSATAMELQLQYLEWLTKYAESSPASRATTDILERWEQILVDLEADPMRTADRLDWTAKLQILQAYGEREQLHWSHSRMKAIDLQYHDVDPRRGLYDKLVERGSMRRLFSDSEVAAALRSPPRDTRAYFRGRCVSEHGASLVAANWDSLVFDTGGDAYKRVPMMDPLRGTAGRVGELLDRASTAAELVRVLGAG